MRSVSCLRKLNDKLYDNIAKKYEKNARKRYKYGIIIPMKGVILCLIILR